MIRISRGYSLPSLTGRGKGEGLLGPPSPTLNQLRHILGQFGGEEHLFTRAGMHKAECAGMEGLTRTNV